MIARPEQLATAPRLIAHFQVFGRPAPQGSKKYVGRGIMIESSKRVAPWREAVKAAFLATREAPPRFDGPVRVEIRFLFERPKKPRHSRPSTKSSGDLDKLLRSTFDALVDVGILIDDSLVVEDGSSKHYVADGEVPGAVIVVREVAAVAAGGREAIR
ncbi:MAG: RusA family crossover junction endodeoxyribonuclease [Planctomycetota bacterium]